jgi:hypothetical protein
MKSKTGYYTSNTNLSFNLKANLSITKPIIFGIQEKMGIHFNASDFFAMTGNYIGKFDFEELYEKWICNRIPGSVRS